MSDEKEEGVSMTRRLPRALAAGALISALVPGAASAGPPIGGCPTGGSWELRYPQHQPQPADLNGDGWVCRFLLPGGGFILIVDNVVPEG